MNGNATTEQSAIRYYEDLGCWMAWGRDIAEQSLTDPRLSSETLEAANLDFLPRDMHEECTDLIETMRRWFVMLDGDQHRSARRAIQPMFSPRRIRKLHGVIHALVEDALEEFAHTESTDVMPDLADKISARSIAHLLGLHGSDDAQLHEWARALAAFLATSYRRDRAIAAQDALRAMKEFIRSAPDTGDGIWSTAAGDEWDRLATSSMLLFGGLETTSGLISFALWHMYGHGLQHAVADSATGEEATAIVERALELYAPLGHVARIAAEDLELGGCPIAKGDLVLVSLSGRDHLFSEPHNGAHPSPHGDGYRSDHIAFGHGMHYCVGAPLARLTASELLTLFARRYPDASVREVTWRTNRTFRGFAHLQMNLTPQPAAP